MTRRRRAGPRLPLTSLPPPCWTHLERAVRAEAEIDREVRTPITGMLSQTGRRPAGPSTVTQAARRGGRSRDRRRLAGSRSACWARARPRPAVLRWPPRQPGAERQRRQPPPGVRRSRASAATSTIEGGREDLPPRRRRLRQLRLGTVAVRTSGVQRPTRARWHPATSRQPGRIPPVVRQARELGRRRCRPAVAIAFPIHGRLAQQITPMMGVSTGLPESWRVAQSAPVSSCAGLGAGVHRRRKRRTASVVTSGRAHRGLRTNGPTIPAETSYRRHTFSLDGALVQLRAARRDQRAHPSSPRWTGSTCWVYADWQ